MKILVIRNADTLGGAELYYLKLHEAWSKYNRDCLITIMTNNERLYERAIAAHMASVRISVFNDEVGTKRGLLRLLVYLPKYLARYTHEIQKLRRSGMIDLALFSGMTEKIVLSPVLRLIGIPVLWLEHGRVFRSSRSRAILILYKAFSRFAAVILAETHDIEVDLQENGIPGNRVQYVGSGIDTERYRMNRNRISRRFTVGFAASLTPEKGIHEFLQTVSVVHRKNPGIRFLIMGTGPELEFTEEYIKKHALGRSVDLVGFQNDTRPFLKRLDVLLSPIRYPGGISLSVAEAMSMGVVPVVSNAGGNRELVIDGVNGYVLTTRSPETSAGRILALRKNNALRMKFSRAARQHIQDFYSAKAWSHKLYEIFARYMLLNR